MPIQSPQELLAYELMAIQDAEKQAMEALKKIKQSAESQQIQRMLDRRQKQGEQVLNAVQKGLEKLDGGSGNTQNAAARGLIQECEKMVKEVQTPAMKQAVTIDGLQKLEHYCIAAWGTVKAMAHEAGEQELAQAMERAVKEGYEWDQQMTELAEGRINPEALQEGEQGDSGERASASGGKQSGGEQRGSGQEDPDLKAREYRGEDGQIHHHTREYMERQGK